LISILVIERCTFDPADLIAPAIWDLISKLLRSRYEPISTQSRSDDEGIAGYFKEEWRRVG
jgi:hypothetical protein